MNRGKILAMLVATSLGASSFIMMSPPKPALAQEVSQTVTNTTNTTNNTKDSSNTKESNNTKEPSNSQNDTNKVTTPEQSNSNTNKNNEKNNSKDQKIESNNHNLNENNSNHGDHLNKEDSANNLNNTSSNTTIKENSKNTIKEVSSQPKANEGSKNNEVTSKITHSNNIVKENSINNEAKNETNTPMPQSFAATPRVSNNFYIFNIPGAQRVQYGTSGQGRPLYYYKIGSGNKLLFMNFEIHGYEDAWGKDGEELTILAHNLIQRLVNENNKGGLNGWTVIVVPASNPDGVIDGWTNNGPGRNQISKKIDLNRDFPTYFKPEYGNRNYTGPNPLGAPEAKDLANLINSLSRKYSNMSLVDVHGWLNETIGDPSLGKAFDNNFGISNKLFSTAAKGYLISYGHSEGALVSLLELPMPRNTSSITSNKYADKIFNSVNYILKNGDGFTPMNAEGQIYDASSLNIRITASSNAAVIGSYSNGTKVKILGRIGDWYKVKSSAGYGYVSKNYVKILSNNTPSPNPNPNPEPAPTQYRVGQVVNLSSGSALNIRKEPNTNSQVVTTLKEGAIVKIAGEQGNWYKVYSPSFGTAYASKNYIDIVVDESNDNAVKPDNQTGTITGIDSKLNVRSMATTSSSVIGQLSNGAQINIVGKEGDWYKINHPSFGYGFVYGQYVNINGNNNGNNGNQESSQSGRVINVSSKLNIRKGPGTSHSVVGSVGPNATVSILGKDGSWYKISYNGVIGYVSSEYIRVNGSNSNNNQGSKTGKVTNISSKLNVRKSPNTSSSIIGSLSNNTKVTILEKANGWYKISYNGMVGYVSGNYITEI